MRTLMAGVLILAALALGGALLLRAPEDAATDHHPASRGPTPSVFVTAQSDATVPTASIPISRYEVSSLGVVDVVQPAAHPEPGVVPEASVQPPALSGIIVGPDGERVTESMIVLAKSTPESGPAASSKLATTCSRDGKFEFKTLWAAEGEIFVAAGALGGMWIQKDPVVARKGDQGLVIPVMKGGLIAGRVSVEDSGFPLDKLLLRMRHWNEDSWRNSELNGGRFEYGPLPPGFVDIEVLLRPFNDVLAEIPAVAVRPGTVPDDPRLDPISVPLARRAELSIVDRAGLPVREFTVLSGDQVVERRALPGSVRDPIYLGAAGQVVMVDPSLGRGRNLVIFLGTRSQTLRFHAPGYLSKTHELTGDAVVELTAAPPLQVTLDPELPGPVGPLKETTALRLHLDPEDHEGRPVPHVTLQGTLGFDASSRTFTVPTLGPGRYRLRAKLIVNRGLSGGSHRLMDPCGPRVLNIGPDGTSLSLTFWPTTWAASLPR